MDLKIINAKIITLCGSGAIKNGTVAIKGGLIEYAGSGGADISAKEVIDAAGDVIMPSPINCHTHLGMSLFRGTAEGRELSDWLNSQIFPMEAKLTEEDVYYGSMLSMLECIKGGCVTVADSYYFNGAAAKAAEESGINLVLLGADMDTDKNYSAVLKAVDEDYGKYNGKSNNLSYIPGCHSVYTCSRKLLEGIADIAAVKKSKTYIHLSETLNEVGNCTVQNGLTPPQYLHSLGYFDNGGIAAHCVYADKDDIALLGQSNISVAHCPVSNLKLGSGIAPVYSMLNSGLNVCLGTDSSASNNSLDMFKEMNYASLLQKGTMNDSSAVEPIQALKMACVNGANALGLNSGAIKKGARADLIRLNIKQPHYCPDNGSIIPALVYSSKSSDVVMSMCGGKIIYENGDFKTVKDINKIYRECEKRIKRLKKYTM